MSVFSRGASTALKAGKKAALAGLKAGKSAGRAAIKNPKTAFLAATVGAAAIYSASQSLEKNGKTLNITSIKNSNGIVVSFDPPESITPGDRIKLSETNTEPKMDSEFVVSDKISNSSVKIESDIKLTKEGTSGKLTLFTTFANQVKATTSSTARATTELVSSTVSEAAGGIVTGFGLEQYKIYIYITIAIIILLIVISISMKFA